MKKDEPLLSVADSILYVCSLLGDRPPVRRPLHPPPRPTAPPPTAGPRRRPAPRLRRHARPSTRPDVDGASPEVLHV